MSKRDEFIAFIDDLKSVSATITEEQRKGLLRRAVQQHDLSAADAVDILRASGLVIGEKENYFEVLGFAIEDFQNQSESGIVSQVEAAHKKLYRESLNAGGRVRPDGKSEEQWRTLLNQARDALKDGQKRQAHIAMLQNDVLPPIGSFSEEAFIDPKTETTPSRTLEQDSMVLIPAGEFQMGSDDYDANVDEKPAHIVYVDAFYMDKYPVTNAQYKEFLDANPQWRKQDLFKDYIPIDYHDGDYLKDWEDGTYPDGKGDHPVTQVSWYAAMAYAQWKGKRLPTEAEWEKASRGGLDGKKYPWGDSIDAETFNSIYKPDDTTEVGLSTVNGYGLYDMSGNVWEWCLDAYDADFYTSSPHRNPFSGENSMEQIVRRFTNVNISRVLRGGPWGVGSEGVRVSHRFKGNPIDTLPTFGFRCVKEIKP